MALWDVVRSALEEARMSDYFVKSFNSRLQSPTTEEDSTTGSSSVATAISSGIEEMKTIQNIVNDREPLRSLLTEPLPSNGNKPLIIVMQASMCMPFSTLSIILDK